MSTHLIRTYRDAHAFAPRRPRKRRAVSATILRLRVALRHDLLDSTLARGADPASQPALAVRATQLERPRHRRALARTLRRVVDEATAPRPAAPPSRRRDRPQTDPRARRRRARTRRSASTARSPQTPPESRSPGNSSQMPSRARCTWRAGRATLNHRCRQAIAQMGDPYA